MTNTPEGRVGGETGGEESNDWFVPKRETVEPEKFDVDGTYSPDDFLRILREQINAALDMEEAPFLAVLEHWEKRVMDLTGEAGELANDVLVGFVEGEDKLVRIRLMFRGEQA